MMKGGARFFLATSLLALAQAAQSNETVTYSYDSLGRLVRVERSGTVNSGVNAQYRYDSADNRTNVTVSTAGSPMVAGGGFETPEMGSGYVYRPTGGPATFSGNSGITANATAWGFESAPEGDQIAFLQGGETPAIISLPVTGLTPGASYAISFRISARPIFSPIAVTASFDGAVLGTFHPPATSFTSVTTAAFTASGSSGTLTFTATAESTYFASGIDLVSIAAAAASPPPASPPPASPPPASPPPASPPPASPPPASPPPASPPPASPPPASPPPASPPPASPPPASPPPASPPPASPPPASPPPPSGDPPPPPPPDDPPSPPVPDGEEPLRGKIEEPGDSPSPMARSRSLAGGPTWLVPENRAGGGGARFEAQRSPGPAGWGIPIVYIARKDS